MKTFYIIQHRTFFQHASNFMSFKIVLTVEFSNLIMKYCDFEIKISTFFLEIQKSKFTFVYFMYLYVGSVVGLQANEGCLDNDGVSCRPLSSQ